jgi:hypothetical protein
LKLVKTIIILKQVVVGNLYIDIFIACALIQPLIGIPK